MWDSIPFEIQVLIIDFVPFSMFEIWNTFEKIDAQTLSVRRVNKMFAEEMQYRVGLCQTKDPDLFVYTVIEQLRLRIVRGRDACIVLYPLMYNGVYYMCTNKETGLDAILYDSLHKTLERELPLVPDVHCNLFLRLLRHVFMYLNRFYVKRNSLPDLKLSFARLR